MIPKPKMTARCTGLALLRIALGPFGLRVRTEFEERLDRAIEAERLRDLEELIAERDAAETRADAAVAQLASVLSDIGVEA